MGVTVATAGHHESLVGVVHHFGLACFNVDLSSLLVAYIDILAIFYGKRLNNFSTFRSENLTINHEVCTGIHNWDVFLCRIVTARTAG